MSLQEPLMKSVKKGDNIVYVIDSSIYTPLIAICGKDLVKAIRELGSILLDLTIYETCNAFWKEYRKLHKINIDEAIQAFHVSLSTSLPSILLLHHAYVPDNALLMYR